jgi:hypothetical protein
MCWKNWSIESITCTGTSLLLCRCSCRSDAAVKTPACAWCMMLPLDEVSIGRGQVPTLVHQPCADAPPATHDPSTCLIHHSLQCKGGGAQAAAAPQGGGSPACGCRGQPSGCQEGGRGAHRRPCAAPAGAATQEVSDATWCNMHFLPVHRVNVSGWVNTWHALLSDSPQRPAWWS